MAAFHLLFFLVLALSVGNGISAMAAGKDDVQVQLRRKAMVQALAVVTRFDLATADLEALSEVNRALEVLENGVKAEPERWKTIFKAVYKTMNGGADDHMIAEAKVLLDQELGGPNSLKRELGIL